MLRLSILLSVSSLLNIFGNCEIPKYVNICRRDDNDLGKCILNSIENLRPYLVKGISEMSVPALEPLEIPDININHTEAAYHVQLQAWNIKCIGGSQFHLRYFKANLNEMIGQVGVDFPQIIFEAEFNISGDVGRILPLNGIGFLRGNITNIKAEMNGHGIWKNRDSNERYLQVDVVKSKIKLGDLTYKVEGRGKNPALAKSFETFYHQNRRAILHMINPLIEITTNRVAKDILNSILEKFTEQEILLP